MPSRMLAVALADPEYKAALSSLGDKGFSSSSIVECDGRQYTHDEIAASFDDAYQRLRPQFSFDMGGKKRVNRVIKRRFSKAVKSEVYEQFHLSWWTIAIGALVLVLAGPLGLVIAIVTCLFEYYFNKDIDGDKQMMYAMGVL